MSGQASTGRKRRPMRLLAAASLAATAGTVILAVAALGDLPDWARTGLASPLSLKSLAIMLAGVTALVLLGLVLARLRGRRREAFGSFHGDQGGSAAIEMALLMPFALMVFLIVIQAAVLFNANMVVHYSAFCAARVAVTEVPRTLVDDDEGPNLVWPPDMAPSKKLEDIRLAAVRALIPISAALNTGDPNTEGTVVRQKTEAVFSHMGATTPGWINRVKNQYDYADKYTQIDLAKPGHWQDGNPDNDCPYNDPHPTDQWGNWGWIRVPYCDFYHQLPLMIWDFWYWEDLHVRVTYQFLLEVPYASRFLGDQVQIPGRTGTQYATSIVTTVSLTNEGGPEIRPPDYLPETAMPAGVPL